MSKLPIISGKKAAKAFIKAGWKVDRQVGSHLILVKTGSDVVLSIPLHKELKGRTLRKLVSLAGFTKEDFITLLK
jgi:predicted RNA binding protein YcfA (HicA-like mRNA interferase family)